MKIDSTSGFQGIPRTSFVRMAATALSARQFARPRSVGNLTLKAARQAARKKEQERAGSKKETPVKESQEASEATQEAAAPRPAAPKRVQVSKGKQDAPVAESKSSATAGSMGLQFAPKNPYAKKLAPRKGEKSGLAAMESQRPEYRE